MYTVFIDGKEGTTGLRIHSRLAERADIRIVTLPEELRKDREARRKALNECDVAFLCLPDKAAVEAVELIENPDVRVLDTSTAHRTAPDWVYGFPELSEERRERIRKAKRLAVPGCHASGFISLIAPLRADGILNSSERLCCTSVTGYSGGGKKMIAQYEDTQRSAGLDAPRQYALGQQHKHLREMACICALDDHPAFSPIVGDYYSGMTVTVPLFADMLAPGKGAEDIAASYAARYRGPVVSVNESPDDGGFISGNDLAGKDSMEVSVAGCADRLLLISRFDNL
ncbi:MAG: N-acetyl-gamma-glutamyl-phosphate reductase, partial [Oscillospiraceae bacterium]|nr:N-acetyl-gamma-glutamyl-phosphate reductase [Oscillospiraceae bacterium]